MSVYTTELRWVCENLVPENIRSNPVDVINTARPSIFDFSYPIFDENYRSVLESKILFHFYTREIGLETVGLWKLKLNTKMNEIMPYYNKLYEVTSIDFNPLYDTDITTTRNIENEGSKNEEANRTEKEGGKSGEQRANVTDGESSSTTSATNKTVTSNNDNKWDLFQDTPQGGLNGVQQQNYLTDARNITDEFDGTVTDTGSTTTTGKDNTTVDETINRAEERERESENKVDTKFNDTQKYVEWVKGKRGSQTYASIIREYIESLVNIDMMIINDLEELFMEVY